MLVTLNTKRTHVQCEAITYMVNTGGYNSSLKMIELVGPTTAKRAIWSNLVKSRARQQYAENTECHISLPSGTYAIKVEPKIKLNRFTEGENLLLFHQGFTVEEREYILGGDMKTPPRHFLDALRVRAKEVPIEPKWEQALWEYGVESGLCSPLLVYGTSMTAWRISETGWKDPVVELAKQWQD